MLIERVATLIFPTRTHTSTPFEASLDSEFLCWRTARDECWRGEAVPPLLHAACASSSQPAANYGASPPPRGGAWNQHAPTNPSAATALRSVWRQIFSKRLPATARTSCARPLGSVGWDYYSLFFISLASRALWPKPLLLAWVSLRVATHWNAEEAAHLHLCASLLGHS